MSTTPSPTEPIPAAQSTTVLRNTPRLTPRGLTILLVIMCIVPAITILTLYRILPPTYEGQLEASITPVALPPDSYYEPHYSDRPKYEKGSIVIRNNSDQEWTHLNIQVNRHYQIHDIEPIAAGQETEFKLSRFISRTGARFSLQHNPLRTVRIYARRPTKDRATYVQEFDLPAVFQ